MTFTGSTAAGVSFSGNITVTVPTPSGTSGTSLTLEIFDGTTLVTTCPPSVSGSNTVFTCANPVVNLGDTYWLEIVSGTALATSTNCIVPIAASPAGPHLLYYTDAGNNVVDSFDVCAQPSNGVTATFALPTGTLANTADTGEIRFDRGSATGDPRVFVLGANGTLVYLDVATAPGTVLATVPFGTTNTKPHHFAVTDVGVSPETLYITLGNTTVQSYTVSQTSPYLTLAQSNTTHNYPRGISLEGAGNDLVVAEYGTGSNGAIAAVNPTTLAIDSQVSVSGEPQRVTGPNAGLNCALVANGANSTVSAVSVVAPGGTITTIGSPITLTSTATYDTFFPPGTPGSGTPGVGGNQGFVVASGTGQIVTCDGKNFTAGATVTTPTNPNVGQSNYSSTAVDSFDYLTGTNSNGTSVLQGYTTTSSSPAFSIGLASGVIPQDISAGP